MRPPQCLPRRILEAWQFDAILIEHGDLTASDVEEVARHFAEQLFRKATLGTPTWIVLSFKADFRWGTDTTATPWYPGARIFRQERPGEWGPVLAQIREALAHFTR